MHDTMLHPFCAAKMMHSHWALSLRAGSSVISPRQNSDMQGLQEKCTTPLDLV